MTESLIPTPEPGPNTTAPEFSEIVSRVEKFDWIPLIAGGSAAVASVLTGRRRAWPENLIIAGIYAGFSAYRDNLPSIWHHIGMGLMQGLGWGLTDRTFPIICYHLGLTHPPPEDLVLKPYWWPSSETPALPPGGEDDKSNEQHTNTTAAGGTDLDDAWRVLGRV